MPPQRTKHIALGILLLCCLSLVVLSWAKQKNIFILFDRQNKQPADVQTVPKTSDTQNENKEWNFEFIESQSGDGLFIEVTLQSGIPNTLPSDMPSLKYKERGGTGPGEERLSAVDPKLLEDIITNRREDTYSLLLADKIIPMKTGDFYHNVDEACGDDSLLVKVVPAETSGNADLTGKAAVILKQPHPAIETSRIVPVEQAALEPELEGELKKQVQELFDNFLSESKYQWEKPGDEQILASSYPKIELFRATDGTREFRYISASWHSERGEEGCCMSGLFELRKNNGADELAQVVPFLPDGIGVAGYNIKKVIQINGMTFIVAGKGYWEWRHEEIYEIVPGQQFWKSYLQSRTSGGC